MDTKGKVVVVTGGGQGLGEALAEGFAARGARAVVVADLNGDNATAVAARIGGLGVRADVSVEADIVALVQTAIDTYGQVDLFFSNAGIGGYSDVFTPDERWEREWRVHVMAHVWAARAVLPAMIERGHGGLVNTASSIALSSQPGTEAYCATKHAALGLSEALALDYHDKGIYVGCACPQGMKTPMLLEGIKKDPAAAFGLESALEPSEAARLMIEGIHQDRFLILTHPEVSTYFQRKASDHDRWLNGMRRMYGRLAGAAGGG